MSGTVTALVLAGGLTGGGVALVASGLRPRRPALAEVLDRLSRPAVAVPDARRRLDLALARPLARFGLPRPRTRQDLAISDKDPAEHLAQQLVIAIAAMAAFGVLPVLWGLGGQLPLWLALIGGALAARYTATRLHAAAEARREQMRETLSTLLDLVGGGLAGGAGGAGQSPRTAVRHTRPQGASFVVADVTEDLKGCARATVTRSEAPLLHRIKEHFLLVPLAPDVAAAQQLLDEGDRQMTDTARLWMDGVLDAAIAAAEHTGQHERRDRYLQLRVDQQRARDEETRQPGATNDRATSDAPLAQSIVDSAGTSTNMGEKPVP